MSSGAADNVNTRDAEYLRVIETLKPAFDQLAAGAAVSEDHMKQLMRDALGQAKSAVHKAIIGVSDGAVLQLGWLDPRHEGALLLDVVSHRFAARRHEVHRLGAPVQLRHDAIAAAKRETGAPLAPGELLLDLWLVLATFHHHLPRDPDRLLSMAFLAPWSGGLMVGSALAGPVKSIGDVGTAGDQPFYVNVAMDPPRVLSVAFERWVPLATAALRGVDQQLRALPRAHSRALEMLAQTALMPNGWQDDGTLGFLESPIAADAFAALARVQDGDAYRQATADAARIVTPAASKTVN